MFAGGGAIPLEAARLGCDVTAIELNPVAHLIERVMLEFPQRYPDLAADVRRWGAVWVDRAWEQLKDIYPQVGPGTGQQTLDGDTDNGNGRRPLAYLWTRTVRCPNPARPEHRVDLVRQTWLARKSGRAIALRAVVDRVALTVRYEVVEASSASALGFDPGEGSRRGQATCRVCGATVISGYVKAEGRAGRMGIAPLVAVVLKSSGRGRDYLPVGTYPLPDDDECARRLAELPVDAPGEVLVANYTQAIIGPQYGLTRFRDLFTPRQLLTLCTLSAGVHQTYEDMCADGMSDDRAAAVATYLGIITSRLTDYSSSLARWHTPDEKMINTFSRQALPMVWDFAETAPFGGASGDAATFVGFIANIIETLSTLPAVRVIRASATSIPLPDASQDAVITDPPYYDNISYADLSDFFYVWLKRSVGFLYPDHLGGQLTPKRNEAVVAPYRHHGQKDQARAFYEQMMAQSFSEAHRVLKPGAPLVCVYAHKTTLGWSTLIEALRHAGFVITEAWPLDTEMKARSAAQGTAALASSIFLVARRRENESTGDYASQVRPQLVEIVQERLATLLDAGVTGADLVIATIGAGLRAYTQFARVELDRK